MKVEIVKSKGRNYPVLVDENLCLQLTESLYFIAHGERKGLIEETKLQKMLRRGNSNESESKRDLSQQTLMSYAFHFADFCSYYKSMGLSIHDLGDEVCNQYISEELAKKRKLKLTSIEAYRAACRSIFEFLHTHEFVSFIPDFRVPLANDSYHSHSDEDEDTRQENLDEDPEFDAADNFLTHDEFELFLKHIPGARNETVERNYLIAMLAYKMGLRRGEFGRNNFSKALIDRAESWLARPEHIQKYFVVKISGKGSKAREGLLDYMLLKRVVSFYKKFRQGFKVVFGKIGADVALGKSSITKIFRTARLGVLANASDFETIERFSRKTMCFHTLRHCFAINLYLSHLEDDTDPIEICRRFLGHVSKTTSRAYLTFAGTLIPELAKKVFGSLGYKSEFAA